MVQNHEMTLLKEDPAPFMAVCDFNSSKLKSFVPHINSYTKDATLFITTFISTLLPQVQSHQIWTTIHQV